MTPKVSVCTITYRPGYIDNLVAGLRSQTFTDFEWVLCDELADLRQVGVENMINGAFPFKHIKPRHYTDLSGTAVALNTALEACEGELVYFMADYMYIHPEALARHWYIYDVYGPRVIISGALVDGITINGSSIYTGAQPKIITVNVGGNPVTFPEHTPPIDWPMKPADKPTSDNLLSIWAKPIDLPFDKRWNGQYGVDWRAGAIGKRYLGLNVFKNTTGDYRWFWAGRNDSAPLALLYEVGGMNEGMDGQHGGIEADMSLRMEMAGCDYLVDTLAYAYMLPHPSRKKETRKG